jgi:4-hydroxybenzoate polyprenyltransferase
MTPRWLSWLRFLRLPNALTVPGDVLAGAALAGASVSPRAMAATVLAYLFGMALNDCADLPRDRVHRPERPLPSGRIPLRAAWAVAGGLALASLILAWQAAPLLLAIIAYTFAKDRLPLGAPLMGLCRVLSVGMGAWPAAMTPALLGALVLWFAYIALLTHLAEREETPASEGKLPWILATLLALGPLGMLVPAPSPAAAPFVLCLLVLLGFSLRLARDIRRRGRVLPSDIGGYIGLLFPLQAAALCVGGFPQTALFLMPLWLLFRAAGRWIRAS